MRILVFGGKGMLGHKLVQCLSEKFEVWTTLRGKFREVEKFGIFERDRTIADIDVTDLQLTGTAIGSIAAFGSGPCSLTSSPRLFPR